MKTGTDKIASAVPYVLPVLGGLLGVAYVNLNPWAFVNPVLAIGLGVLLGWGASRLVLGLLGRRGR